MIMPCMNLTSASEGFRGGASAVSGVRVLLLWPGAPGCTIDTPGSGFTCWHDAVTEVRENKEAATSKNLSDMNVLSWDASRFYVKTTLFAPFVNLAALTRSAICWTARRALRAAPSCQATI